MAGTELGVWLQIASTLLVFLLTVIVTVIGWYLRKYIISEVEKNSAFRIYAAGTEFEDDEGKIGQLHAMQTKMEQQHDDTAERLNFMLDYIDRIAEAVEANVDRPDYNGKWRKQDD